MFDRLLLTTGFTLLELIITVSIAGLLAAVAIPSFNKAISSNRLTAQTNDFVTALNLARSEAIKRGRNVLLTKTGINWEDGWQVFVDMAADNAYNPPVDFVLREYPTLAAGYTLRANNNATFIRFTSAGLSSFSGSFVFCDNRDGNNIPEADTARSVIMTSTGKVRIGADDDHDGIPAKDKTGNELTSCVPPF